MSCPNSPESVSYPRSLPKQGLSQSAVPTVRDENRRSDRPLAVTRPLELTTIPSACRLARWHTRDILQRWGVSDELEWQTVQVVSELVGNCCSHAASGKKDKLSVCSLTLRLFYNALCVEVRDSSPVSPILRDSGPDDESGRGLQIVAALCVRLKILATPPGKTVVAVVPRLRPPR
jgi:anti-sigma regulatory factor (Ser/Thr protein kinase)